MKFFLWQVFLGSKPRVEIEMPDYDMILRAWNDLTLIAEVEQSWDSLIQNYVEFETELRSSDIQLIARSHASYADLQDIRLGFSRRLSNLLHACRSYLDHTPYHLGKLQNNRLKELFAAETTKIYDSNFSHRFMAALRKYSLHRGIPLYSVLFGAHWIESDIEEERRLRKKTEEEVNQHKIRVEKPFKPTVLEEVGIGRDALDVAELAREYLEGLGAVHDILRAAWMEHLDDCKTEIRSAIERYAAENNRNVVELAAAKCSSDGAVIEYQYIFEGLPERIERLTQRNGSLGNLRSRIAKG